jgi:WD40 repeat protein/tRNA A-37 threonylcarbamoyl transferase component Bud32
VALKRIQRRYAGDAETCRRFLVEAEITGQLEHPGIVPVYGLVRDAAGEPCYAMRFIEGESLRDAIKRFHGKSLAHRAAGERRLALRHLLGCFVAVCNTLAYAHSRSILHRDLKPSNILLGKFGETLVVDWGLAKPLTCTTPESAAARAVPQPGGQSQAEASTRVGQVMGTPGFMSPEQAAGRWNSLGPASDIYSLGATLHVLLTGQVPAAENAELKSPGPIQVQTAERSPPSAQQSPLTAHHTLKDAPPELSAICSKAMALRPEDRYRSALELAADIEHWLADEPVSAWEEPWTSRARRWLSRRRTLVVGVAAAVLVAMVGLAVGLVLLAAANDRAHLARIDAEKQRDAARLNLYVSSMNLAGRAWEDGQADRMLELLEAQRPQRATEPDLRGWEWYYLWGLCRSDHLQSHKALINSVAFSKDGSLLASAGYDGMVRIWDMKNGRELHALKSKMDAVRGVVFSPDGKQLVAAEDGGTLTTWDTQSGRLVRTFRGHVGPVDCLAFSPDGRQLASSGQDRTVRTWEASRGKALLAFEGHAGAVRGLAYSPDSQRLASASLDASVKIWDVTASAAGAPLYSLKGHTDKVGSVAFSPDGRRFVSAGWDRTVLIWDLPNPTTESSDAGTRELTVPVLTLRGHTAPIYTVAFSSDGNRLASGSYDRVIKIWEVATGQEVMSLKGHTGAVYSVAFNPVGRYLATAGDDGTVRLWDAPPLTSDQGLHPESLRLVQSLFARPLPREEVIALLRQDASLSERTRRQAMALAEHYPEEALRLNNTAWGIVVKPNAEPSAYRLALRQAEAACRVVPQDGSLLNTLGVAQYRTGMYKEAIATLLRANELNSARYRGSTPLDLAPLAMAYFQLGQTEKALTNLRQLREAARNAKWINDEDAQGLLRQAEALLAEGATEARDVICRATLI